jgi:hypothetical protein
MFVTFVSMYHILSRDDHTGILQAFSPQLGVSYFLCRGSVIFRHELVKVVTRDKQYGCPGCDDNREAPIGCFVAKDDTSTMGVIHQQLSLLKQGGTV